MADKQVVIEFVGDTSKLEASFQQVQQQAQKTGQVSTQAFQQFNAENQKAAQSVKQTATESQKLNDQFREITKTIAADVIKEVAEAAKEASTNYLSLRTQLNNAKEALFKLGEEGRKGSKEWNDQIKVVTKLSTEYKELSKTVNNLGSSTKVLSGLLEATRGVVAGFEIAKGATALFGSENKNLEKTIKELAGAMAILQGLQEVQNLLDADSAAILLIENGQRLAGAAATKLQTYAESEYVIVSKLATAAQWALNAAMEANPIMLLVGAIGAAVAALLYFTSQTEEADEATVQFNEDLSKLNDTVQKGYVKRKEQLGELTALEARMLEINSESSKKSLAVILEYEKKKEEIRGKYAPEKEVVEMAKLAEQQTALLAKIEEDRQLQISYIRFAALEELAEKTAEEQLKEEKKLNEHLRNLQKLQEDYIKDQLDNYDEATKKLNEALIAQGDDTTLSKDQRIQYYFLGGMSKDDIANRLADTLTQAEKDAADVLNSRIKNQDQQNAVFKAYREEKAQKDIDSEKAKQKQIELAALDSASRLNQALFSIEAQHREKQLSEDLAVLEKKKEKELSNKNLTIEQREKLERKYARLEGELRKKAFEQEKASAIAQATINMALGIAKTFATNPPNNPASIALDAISIATIVATTAAQIAVIATQQAPAFAKGTKGAQVTPAGFKWVGEEGPELIHTPGGEKILTHSDSMELLKSYNLPAAPSFTPPIPNAPELVGGGNIIVKNEIDYKKMSKSIAEELRNNPQVVVNIDKGGLSVHVIEKGKKVEKLNNRYSG